MTRALTLISFLFFSAAVQAVETESASVGSETRMEISDVRADLPKAMINLQLGASAFDYTGDASGSRNDQGMAGALTVELGEINRFMETGFMVYQSRAEARSLTTNQTEEINNTYLAIPLMAKIFPQGGSRGFYIKGGMLTSFLLSSSKDADVRNIDLVGSLGAGGKLKMNEKSDFLIEATYNRGFLDQLRTRGDTYQQGFVLMGGVAFQI